MTNPWRKILGIGVITFFVVLLITYSYCQGNSACVSPLQPNLSTASKDQLQSAVTKAKKKVKKKTKTSILPPGPSYADPALMPSSTNVSIPAPATSVPASNISMPPAASMPVSESAPTPPPPPPPPPPEMTGFPPPMAPTTPDASIAATMPSTVAATMPSTEGTANSSTTAAGSDANASVNNNTSTAGGSGVATGAGTGTGTDTAAGANSAVGVVDTTTGTGSTLAGNGSRSPDANASVGNTSGGASLPDMFAYCDSGSVHSDTHDGAFQDKFSSQFLDTLPNIKVTGGTNRSDNFVNPCHLRFLAMGLAPFEAMLKTIKTKVIISRESLGPGYRAFTSIDGETVVIIAPGSYSRPIPPQEFLNLVRHEFGHVLHILWLNDPKRSEWEALIHTNATNEQGVLSLSEYGATRGEPGKDPHVYEALAEDLLSLMLFGRDAIEAKRPEFLPVYDFLNNSFTVDRFGSRRYQGTVDYNATFPSGRDATRLTEYPLPEVTP